MLLCVYAFFQQPHAGTARGSVLSSRVVRGTVGTPQIGLSPCCLEPLMLWCCAVPGLSFTGPGCLACWETWETAWDLLGCSRPSACMAWCPWLSISPASSHPPPSFGGCRSAGPFKPSIGCFQFLCNTQNHGNKWTAQGGKLWLLQQCGRSAVTDRIPSNKPMNSHQNTGTHFCSRFLFGSLCVLGVWWGVRVGRGTAGGRTGADVTDLWPEFPLLS